MYILIYSATFANNIQCLLLKYVNGATSRYTPQKVLLVGTNLQQWIKRVRKRT